MWERLRSLGGRSGHAIALCRSWEIPFSHAQAWSFIESLDAANPDSPGEWFRSAVVEAATGVHIGDVAAGVNADDPRLADDRRDRGDVSPGRGYAREAVAWLLDHLFVERRECVDEYMDALLVREWLERRSPG